MDKYIKEKIAYYKLWITLFYTTDAGLIAWTFNNYDKIDNIKLIIVIISILITTLFVLTINQKTRVFIGRIGE